MPFEFFVNLCCPKKWGSTFVMAGPKCNVVFDDGGIPEVFEDTPLLRSKEANLLQALKAIMQETPPRPFQRFDIMGLPHITSGHGLYTNAEIAVIPWDCLEDFVEGEQNNPNFPCKFTRTKDHFRSSAPNTLTHLEQLLQHLFIGETSYKVTFT